MTQAADPRIGVVRVVLLVEASDSRAEPSTIGSVTVKELVPRSATLIELHHLV
jgi:hypothetical protein